METKDDMVVMKGGRMMVVRFGEMKPMDMVMTLSNGTKVAMDGTITMPDGTSRMLMDGEAYGGNLVWVGEFIPVLQKGRC